MNYIEEKIGLLNIESTDGALWGLLYSFGEEYVNAISKITILNEGHPGYNDIVKNENITIEVGEKRFRLDWFHFGHTNNNENVNKLVKKIDKDASPLRIEAQNVVSHETFFYPFPDTLAGSKHTKISLNGIHLKKNLKKRRSITS